MKIIIRDRDDNELCEFSVKDEKIYDRQCCELVSIITVNNEDVKILKIRGIKNEENRKKNCI